MFGPAGWTHTPGVPRLGAKLKPYRAGAKGKGAGSGRFSGFKTRQKQREYQEARDFKAGKY